MPSDEPAMVVRAARLDDATDIARIWQAGWREVHLALLSVAEKHIAAAGFDRAWLAVVAGNEGARRFYSKAGWIDDGPFDHAAPGPDGPIPVPTHRYVKRLGPGPVRP